VCSRRRATAPATPFKPAGERADGEEAAADGTISESDLDDDNDVENWLSVAAIEAELKPEVIQSFDTIAGAHGPMSSPWPSDSWPSKISLTVLHCASRFAVGLQGPGAHRRHHSRGGDAGAEATDAEAGARGRLL
jgi:hypothetical protein